MVKISVTVRAPVFDADVKHLRQLADLLLELNETSKPKTTSTENLWAEIDDHTPALRVRFSNDERAPWFNIGAEDSADRRRRFQAALEDHRTRVEDRKAKRTR